MRDMNWDDDNTGQKSTAHPMAMRSRKCSRLKDYYDYKEYSDFDEDLIFLFEDELPNLECRPRRKSRKRRSPIAIKTDFSDTKQEEMELSDDMTTSNIENARNLPSTSLADPSFCKRPNLKKATPNDLENCNSDNLTSSETSAGIFDTNNSKKSKNTDSRPPKRKSTSGTHFSTTKRQKSEILSKTFIETAKEDTFDTKRTSRSSKMPKLSCDNDLGRSGHLKLNCATEKLRGTTPQTKPNPTVTKMTLRRRHSTPSLGGSLYGEEKIEKMQRTISTPAGVPERELPRKKGREYPKFERRDSSVESNDETYSCDEISDSEQFVDSPDSGFSSESSCSAVTPDGESVEPLNFDPTKVTEQEPDSILTRHHRISRTSSNESGMPLHNLANNKPIVTESTTSANKSPLDGELRLVLCQESVLEAQRLEHEAKKKQEEEFLREKYQCRWVDCSNPFESRCGAELHTHLEKCHANNYCCRWKDCKFFEIKSRKLTFLQRHIGEHSGEKPHKCIFDGCDATFASRSSWKRHVEAHYSEVAYPKAKVGGENGFPRYLLNSRRIKDKRKTLANRHDCMDNRTLSFIRNALIQNEVALETDEYIGDTSDVTFDAEIIGEKTGKNSKKYVLVKWKPENMLPNEWVLKSEIENEKKVKKAELPQNAKTALKRLFFFGRDPCRRKPTTKPSLLQSLF